MPRFSIDSEGEDDDGHNGSHKERSLVTRIFPFLSIHRRNDGTRGRGKEEEDGNGGGDERSGVAWDKLPPHLMERIFARLDFSELLQMGLLSHPTIPFLLSPTFWHLHAASHPALTTSYVLIQSIAKDHGLLIRSSSGPVLHHCHPFPLAFLHPRTSRPSKRLLLLKSKRTLLYLASHCGLLFFASIPASRRLNDHSMDDFMLLLCNPSTRAYTRLPAAPFLRDALNIVHPYLVDMDVDSEDGNYRIVILRPILPSNAFVATIYDSRKGEWMNAQDACPVTDQELIMDRIAVIGHHIHCLVVKGLRLSLDSELQMLQFDMDDACWTHSKVDVEWVEAPLWLKLVKCGQRLMMVLQTTSEEGASMGFEIWELQKKEGYAAAEWSAKRLTRAEVCVELKGVSMSMSSSGRPSIEQEILTSMRAADSMLVWHITKTRSISTFTTGVEIRTFLAATGNEDLVMIHDDNDQPTGLDAALIYDLKAESWSMIHPPPLQHQRPVVADGTTYRRMFLYQPSFLPLA